MLLDVRVGVFVNDNVGLGGLLERWIYGGVLLIEGTGDKIIQMMSNENLLGINSARCPPCLSGYELCN